MKKAATVIIFLLAALGVRAEVSDIVVGYDMISSTGKKHVGKETNKYMLLANGMVSKFYSPQTEYFDSIKSTPEGLKRLEEIQDASIAAGTGFVSVRGDGMIYVLKNFREGKLRHYDRDWLDAPFVYEEPIEKWNWVVTDSTRTILGYECVKAEADYHGRRWTAWFAPEIPVYNGPWKLDGVPGLILEAYTQGDDYRFVATGIEQKSKPIGEVYLAKDYERTDRIKFLRDARYKMDNAESIFQGMFGGRITFTGPDGEEEKMFEPASVLDFMETDYHPKN